MTTVVIPPIFSKWLSEKGRGGGGGRETMAWADCGVIGDVRQRRLINASEIVEVILGKIGYVMAQATTF